MQFQDHYNERFYKIHKQWKRSYEAMAKWLNSNLDFTTCMDMGCGSAYLLEYLSQYDKNVHGIEGSPSVKPFIHPSIRDKVQQLDLCNVLDVGQYDLVISMEVGEHISPEYMDTYVSNICRASHKWLVFTACYFKSNNMLHINTKKRWIWVRKIRSHGFVIEPNLTQKWLDEMQADPTFKGTPWFTKAIVFYLGGQDSNLQPSAPKADVPPIELPPNYC